MSILQRILVGVIGAVILTLFIHDRYLQYKIDKQQSPSVGSIPVSTMVKSMTHYTDSEGRKHVLIPEKANEIKESKENLKGTVGILDTAAKALDIAAKKIDQVTKVNFELSQENLVLKAERDSIKKKTTYTYKDKYLNLSEVKMDSSANIIANYTFDTDLNWVDYSNRSWLLASKKQYTDIFSNNRAVTIKGVNRVTIQHAASQFGLRLKAASRYNFENQSFGIGPGIEMSINRFDISGYYYYNPTLQLTPINTSKWRPLINVEYNILQF